MAGLTQAQAETNLAAWIAASEAVASSQSYTIGDRTLTRANAKECREMVKFWDGEVQRLARLEGPRTRTRYVVPK